MCDGLGIWYDPIGMGFGWDWFEREFVYKIVLLGLSFVYTRDTAFSFPIDFPNLSFKENGVYLMVHN